MMPSVSELIYFLEITNTLNLSLAAKNLKVSQSSLSRAMQNMECIVGTKLFVRHKKGVTLTPAGTQVLAQIKPLILTWQNTKLLALASHEEVEGDIKVGCHSALGIFMHGIVKELLETYPKLTIELEQGNSDEITQQVIDMKVSLGLVSGLVSYPDLIARELKKFKITLWVCDDHHKLQDIHSGEAVLISGPNVKHNNAILKYCKDAGIVIKRLLKVDSIDVIANLTMNGCGIGILPACYVDAIGNNKLKPVANAPVIEDCLSLIYRKEYANIKAIEVVLNVIKVWVKAHTCLTTSTIKSDN